VENQLGSHLAELPRKRELGGAAKSSEESGHDQRGERALGDGNHVDHFRERSGDPQGVTARGAAHTLGPRVKTEPEPAN
jgi:hypothetical protein